MSVKRCRLHFCLAHHRAVSCRKGSAKRTLSDSVLNPICPAQLLSRLKLVKNQYFLYLWKRTSSNNLGEGGGGVRVKPFPSRLDLSLRR